jgi:hypothetical protein
MKRNAFLEREEVLFADSVRLVDNLSPPVLAGSSTNSYNTRKEFAP